MNLITLPNDSRTDELDMFLCVSNVVKGDPRFGTTLVPVRIISAMEIDSNTRYVQGLKRRSL